MFLYINGVTADQAVLHAAISLNRAKEVLDNSGLPIHLEQAGTKPSNYNQTIGSDGPVGRRHLAPDRSRTLCRSFRCRSK